MNSPTHSLLALAILSKRGNTVRNWAALIGSLIPDVAIYIWAPWQTYVNGVSGREMWRELYFEDTMQLIIAPPNSIPVMIVFTFIGWLMRAKTKFKKTGLFLLVFGLAALIHISTDMPVHGHDAYRHFWPLSDWRLHSHFSYWQRSHGALWISLIEMAIALVSIIVLWRRFPKLWIKIILTLLGLSYFVMQVMIRLGPSGPPV